MVPGTLPNGWVWIRFGELGGFPGGGTPSKERPDFWDGQIPWVSPKDMKRPYMHDAIDHVSPLGVELIRKDDPERLIAHGGPWNNYVQGDPSTDNAAVPMEIGNSYPTLCPYIYGSMTIQNYPTFDVPSGYRFLGNTLASVSFFRSPLLDEKNIK